MAGRTVPMGGRKPKAELPRHLGGNYGPGGKRKIRRKRKTKKK